MAFLWCLYAVKPSPIPVETPVNAPIDATLPAIAKLPAVTFAMFTPRRLHCLFLINFLHSKPLDESGVNIRVRCSLIASLPPLYRPSATVNAPVAAPNP